MVTPEFIRLITALSIAVEALLAKLIEATAGPLLRLLATQLIPETISAMVPVPSSLRTLTETTFAPFATPLY